MTEINNLKSIVESLLFVSEKPLLLNRIKDVIGACREPLSRDPVGGLGTRTPEGQGKLGESDNVSPSDIKKCVDELNAAYKANGHSFTINEVAGGFQIRTLPEFHPYLKKLYERRNEGILSNAALETLSIVAYKQPINRAEIDSIRGVDSSAIVRGLMEKKLIRITGRAEVLGRPLLYGTSNNFLELLGLASIKDLPKIEEVK